MIGFTCGAFDLLHAGHIVMLEESKSYCDHLIVGLQTDPTIDRPEKNKPIQSVYERFVQLNAVKYIDRTIPYDTEESLIDLLKSQHINIRFVGEDYRDKEFLKQLKEISSLKHVKIINISAGIFAFINELLEYMKKHIN